MTRRKILTRSIWIVSLVSLFTDIASEMLYPVVPIFLREIGFTVALIGLLEGMAELTSGFSKGFFGNLSDKSGKRIPFIRTGYLLSALAKPMMGILIAPAWIFMARISDRIGKGIRTGARDALLSAEATPETRARVFGFHRAMDTLGASLGPVVSLIFLAWLPGHYRQLFILALFPGMMAVFLTRILKEGKSNRTESRPKTRAPAFDFVRYWKKAPQSYRLLVAGLLLFCLFNSSDAFLLLSLKEKGFTDSGIIGIYIFYNVVYAIMSYPVGILADRTNLHTVLFIGLALFAVVYGSISFVHTGFAILFLFLIYGLYASATEGISKALISNIVEKTDTATAIGFYTGFASVAGLLASVVAGIVWTEFSSKGMFLYSTAGVIGVLIYFLFISLQRRIPDFKG